MVPATSQGRLPLEKRRVFVGISAILVLFVLLSSQPIISVKEQGARNSRGVNSRIIGPPTDVHGSNNSINPIGTSEAPPRPTSSPSLPVPTCFPSSAVVPIIQYREPVQPDVYRKAVHVRDAYVKSHIVPRALWQSNVLPSLVHIIWLGGPMPPSAQSCLSQWRSLNPTHEVLVWDDDNANFFVHTHFPHLEPFYMGLPRAVMRSDWLRLMLLNVFGGVYADIDACPLKPISQWRLPAGTGAVFGIEVDSTADDWAKWWSRKMQICSWTLASVPGHPIWLDMVHTSAARIRSLARGINEATGNPEWPQGYDLTGKVVEVTGPAVVTDVAFMYMSRFGNTSQAELHGLEEPRLFGDALLLPITGFSPGRGIMGSKPTSDPLAYVEHLFAGSWKRPY